MKWNKMSVKRKLAEIGLLAAVLTLGFQAQADSLGNALGSAMGQISRALQDAAKEQGSPGGRPSGGSGGSLSQDEASQLYSAAQKKDDFGACANLFPENQPLSKDIAKGMQPMALCSDHFAVLYSKVSKTPVVVVERLDAALLRDAKGEERTNAFFPDPRIPKSARAELDDYKGSSMDRGHNAPAADQPTQRAMGQSFALSNMIPQDQTHNRKIWSKVEGDVRKYAQRAKGHVYVYTGPVFTKDYRTIGRNSVWVPAQVYKLVYDASTRKAWAYVIDNRSDVSIGHPDDYDTFVKKTGLRLLGNLPISGSV